MALFAEARPRRDAAGDVAVRALNVSEPEMNVARAGAHNRRTDIRRFRRLAQKAEGGKQKEESRKQKAATTADGESVGRVETGAADAGGRFAPLHKGGGPRSGQGVRDVRMVLRVGTARVAHPLSHSSATSDVSP